MDNQMAMLNWRAGLKGEQEAEKERAMKICDLPNCDNYAKLTIDTPNSKDVPICENCFKKVNAIGSILQNSREPLSTQEIFTKVNKNLKGT